jgi:bifunctional non-homologous end joining protein LigD
VGRKLEYSVRVYRTVPSNTGAHPPSSSEWIHEIKHDGYWLMARKDLYGVRLFIRNGHDWAHRYPLIVQAMNLLPVRSCLIDGEARGRR